MTHTHMREAEVLHDRFVATMADLEVWAKLMRSAAVHRQRGPVNVMMITAQMPEATLVLSRDEWEDLGHQVHEGQRGIQIFTIAQDEGSATPSEVFHPDGFPMLWQAPELYKTCIRYYDTTTVFDISQTTAANDEDFRRTQSVPSPSLAFLEDRILDELETMALFMHVDKKIPERSDIPTEETILPLLQELARGWIRLEWDPEAPSRPTRGDWGANENEALSAAHVAARMLGMRTTGPAPVPQVLGLPASCNPPIKVSAMRVIRVAREMYKSIVDVCPCCVEGAPEKIIGIE